MSFVGMRQYAAYYMFFFFDTICSIKYAKKSLAYMLNLFAYQCSANNMQEMHTICYNMEEMHTIG